MRRLTYILAALVLVATNSYADSTITEIAIDNPAFSTLVTALQATGLDDVLDDDGPFTVFAPTDDAFDDLPEGLLDDLLNDTGALEQVLLYHVVAGTVLSTDLTAGNVSTLQGNDITVTLDEGVFINTSEVTDADIEASNGVIHVIDEVLIPPTIVEMALATEGEFEILATALAEAAPDAQRSQEQRRISRALSPLNRASSPLHNLPPPHNLPALPLSQADSCDSFRPMVSRNQPCTNLMAPLFSTVQDAQALPRTKISGYSEPFATSPALTVIMPLWMHPFIFLVHPLYM